MIYRLYFSSEIVIRGRRKTEIIRIENFEKEEAGAGGDHGGDVVETVSTCVIIESLLLSLSISSMRISVKEIAS